MILTILSMFLVASSGVAADPAAKPAPEFYEPVERVIEGWTVRIDPELLDGSDKKRVEMAAEALKSLANHLQRIRYIVPEPRLKELQRLPIWIDYRHELTNMQYHPSEGWLIRNGFDPRLEKHVHIPRAEALLDSKQWAKHPYVVLHELAHAYHDQVLGFDNPEIVATYEEMKTEGLYKKVLLYTGKQVEHYGLSNPKEYFAESTEAYFGVNDFYPFVRAELREHDPRMFRLLRDIWGEVR